jgi:DNA (cytosine-5)-methyltransferase 1
VQGDALAYLADHWAEFDAFHASPPCQDHSQLQNASPRDNGTGWLLAATIAAFRKTGRPWVVENVPGPSARQAMPGALTLCGSEFGLGAMCHDGKWRQLRRHRLFLSNTFLVGAGGCCHRSHSLGVYGEGSGANNVNGRRGAYQGTTPERVEAMGIDWMDRRGLPQAIPPAFTEFIGEQLITQLKERAA